MKLGQAASKRSILEALLRDGMVLVALDARCADVVVPPHLTGDLQLRLNLSHNFGLPLKISTWGVEATLTFAANAFDCKVPWSAIFLLVSHASGQPYLFPEDIPNELLAQNQIEGQPNPAAPQSPRLALVSEAAGEAAEAEVATPPEAAPTGGNTAPTEPILDAPQREPRRGAPHLKLVK